MLTDSNGIAAHLLLELMPELRWQDIPLGFIFKFINVIPHTHLFGKQLYYECLWDLSVTLSLSHQAQPAQQQQLKQS